MRRERLVMIVCLDVVENLINYTGQKEKYKKNLLNLVLPLFKFPQFEGIDKKGLWGDMDPSKSPRVLSPSLKQKFLTGVIGPLKVVV